LRGFRNIFKPPFRPYLVDEKYRVIPAFECGGEQFYMFDSQMEVPTGRQFTSLTFYAEMDCRIDREYLEMHTKAMEKVMSDPKKLNIGIIAQLNVHLKERLDLMIPPEFIYKLASVVFFTKEESLYKYDFDYNKKKIQRWKEAGATLDFFLKTPLTTLIPSLKSHEKASPIYLGIAEAVAETHRQHLFDILSAKEQKIE
jgi:hypothetical protein